MEMDKTALLTIAADLEAGVDPGFHMFSWRSCAIGEFTRRHPEDRLKVINAEPVLLDAENNDIAWSSRALILRFGLSGKAVDYLFAPMHNRSPEQEAKVIRDYVALEQLRDEWAQLDL